MGGSYESYQTARGRVLSARDALRVVLTYATDFISRGDIDVMFTLSGGAISTDGQSADPAVWADWIDAWRAVEAEGDEPLSLSQAGELSALDMQHGFRALHVFLAACYQPVDSTPMSRVRDDCVSVLNDAPAGASVWAQWLDAIAEGESADITFRLTQS